MYDSAVLSLNLRHGYIGSTLCVCVCCTILGVTNATPLYPYELCHSQITSFMHLQISFYRNLWFVLSRYQKLKEFSSVLEWVAAFQSCLIRIVSLIIPVSKSSALLYLLYIYNKCICIYIILDHPINWRSEYFELLSTCKQATLIHWGQNFLKVY